MSFVAIMNNEQTSADIHKISRFANAFSFCNSTMQCIPSYPFSLDFSCFLFAKKHIITSKGNFPSHGLGPTNIPQTHKCLTYN